MVEEPTKSDMDSWVRVTQWMEQQNRLIRQEECYQHGQHYGPITIDRDGAECDHCGRAITADDADENGQIVWNAQP